MSAGDHRWSVEDAELDRAGYEWGSPEDRSRRASSRTARRGARSPCGRDAAPRRRDSNVTASPARNDDPLGHGVVQGCCGVLRRTLHPQLLPAVRLQIYRPRVPLAKAWRFGASGCREAESVREGPLPLCWPFPRPVAPAVAACAAHLAATDAAERRSEGRKRETALLVLSVRPGLSQSFVRQPVQLDGWLWRFPCRSRPLCLARS